VGKRILVTAGSTVEHIDPIRVITNLSSGKMGVAIAKEAYKMGAAVTLLLGHGSYNLQELHPEVKVKTISTGKEMAEEMVSQLDSTSYDIAILSAAVADFRPIYLKSTNNSPTIQNTGKIDTRLTDSLELSLVSTRKLVNEVKKLSLNKNIFLVAFKAEFNISNKDLIEKAYVKLRESKADIVVANDVGRKESFIGSENNEIFVINKNKGVAHFPAQNKQTLAKQLLELIGTLLTTTSDPEKSDISKTI
jgi:phosphopantothenoylcysteine decarboxylase/phosphopantothenate--cysteine ligase